MYYIGNDKGEKRNNQMNWTLQIRKLEIMRTLNEKNDYRYVGILECVTIKQEVKEKIKTEYFRKTRKY